MAIGLPAILVLVVLLIISACTSATEAAVLAINKVRLRHLADSGNRSAQLTYSLLPQLDRVIGTLLILNNVVNIAISSIGSWICVELLGPVTGLPVATAVITVVILLVGEVTPKTFAATHPQPVAFLMVRPLLIAMAVFYTTANLFMGAAYFILRLLRIPMKRRSPLVTEEEIKVMIQMGREAGVLAEDELRMLQRIFEFSDSMVKEVMIPRNEIAGVDLEATAEDALDKIIEEGHSRLPVYRGNLDRIVGVIYTRDLLAMIRHGGLFVLSDLIRPIPIVHERKRIAELLVQFQRERRQIAVVQDSHGKTVGLVTLKDIVEEIVGEIGDEQQDQTPG
jgi:CBS domain containing-hemolysin-like protein